MTREEAIRILNNIKPLDTTKTIPAYMKGQAFDMAIKALSTKTCLDCGYQYLDDDECPRCGSERWE
jgi:rubrerythrin